MKYIKYCLLGFVMGIVLVPLGILLGSSDSFYMVPLIFSPIIYFLFGLIIQLIFVAGFFQKGVEDKTRKIVYYWISFIVGLFIFFFGLMMHFACFIPNFCPGY